MISTSPSVGIISGNENIADQLNELSSKPFNISVVFQTNEFAKGMKKIKELKPNIVLLESSLIKEDITGILLKLKMSYPECKVILMVDGYSLNPWLQYLKAGAKAILEKPNTESYSAAIFTVFHGGIYLDPVNMEPFLDQCANKVQQADGKGNLLTDREIQILKVLAEGNTVKKAGNLLELSPKTVDTHKANIMRKLQLHNRADLIKYALRKKIIPL